MSKKILFIAIFVILLIVAAVAFYLNYSAKKKKEEADEQKYTHEISLSIPTFEVSLIGGRSNQKVSILIGLAVGTEKEGQLLQRSITILTDIIFTSLSNFLPRYLSEHENILPNVLTARIENALMLKLPGVGIDPKIIIDIFVVHIKILPVI